MPVLYFCWVSLHFDRLDDVFAMQLTASKQWSSAERHNLRVIGKENCMHWIYEISDQELKRTTKIVSAHFIIINHRIFEFSEGVTGNWQEGCMRTPVLRIVSGSTWRVTWIFDKKKPKLVSGGVGIPVLAVALICWKSLHVSRHACYCEEFKWCDVL